MKTSKRILQHWPRPNRESTIHITAIMNAFLRLQQISLLFFVSSFLLSETFGRKVCPNIFGYNTFDMHPRDITGRWYEVARSKVKREKNERCGMWDITSIQTPKGFVDIKSSSIFFSFFHSSIQYFSAFISILLCALKPTFKGLYDFFSFVRTFLV